MILFRYVRWKNLLSTGNYFTEIKLNGQSNTLVVGENGSGKSTMLDALCLGLFGKPFRPINKPQVVNSINNKDCVIEVEFDTSNKSYKIVRGIKPNIFEIWQDGELINQDAASRDYQKVLEQQILKLNYKTFTQVVILGSASFVPFMQLPNTQRREVIEDILDIRIFSTMNQLLKEKANETKAEIVRIENEISSAKTKVEAQTTIIKTISEAKADNIRSLEAKVVSSTEGIGRIQSEIDVIIGEVGVLKEQTTNKDKILEDLEKAKAIRSKIHQKIETCEHHTEFFSEHDVCPSCDQTIAEEYKQKIIQDLNEKIEDNNGKIGELETILTNLNEKVS